MDKKLARMLSGLMITTALLGFAAVFPVLAVTPQPDAYLFVDPKDNVFPPPYMGVGSTFNINVTVANVTNFGAVSWHLVWNSTLLNCINMQEIMFHTLTPPSDYSNIWSLSFAYGAGSADYSQTWMNYTMAEVGGYGPAYVNTTNFPPEGKLASAMLTMRVMMKPTMAQGSLSCFFNFTSGAVVDWAGNPIIDKNLAVGNPPVDGYYRINWQPPIALPYFVCNGNATYTASHVGEVFNIPVTVNNLDAGWEAVGFEFKLGYNATMLDLLSVTAGPWILGFGAPPNQGVLNLTFLGSGYAQVGEVVLPDENGTWHSPFPSSGSSGGVLAILTFNATLQGVFPTIYACELRLYDTKISNWLGQPIPQGSSLDGSYRMTPKVLGRMIDIYTQWPFPYGGQGPLQPSDMFWPQKEVCLYAKVTYNEWPEQMKDVAFSIQAPDGTLWGVIYARTDENGIAKATFRLPWPCDNPEQWFGVWTITGTVDIACIIVNDTLQFHYDYLVRIFKVTVDHPEGYNHEPTDPYVINATITYGSYLWQDSIDYLDQLTGTIFHMENFTVAVTALDETGVPFGFSDQQLPINFAGENVFCQYRNTTVNVYITVPKFARAGMGELDTAILDDWPFNGGTVQSGYYDPDTGTWLPYCPTPINILAA